MTTADKMNQAIKLLAQVDRATTQRVGAAFRPTRDALDAAVRARQALNELPPPRADRGTR